MISTKEEPIEIWVLFYLYKQVVIIQKGKVSQMTAEDFQVIDNCLMVRLPEEIDHHEASMIGERTDRFLMRDDVQNVVFDFEDTRFMDSSGIGVIMGRYRMVHLLGGEVWAANANERMKKILVMSGVTKIIQIYEEEHV